MTQGNAEQPDLIGRDPICKTIISALLDEKKDRASGRVIALQGEWGVGKTFIVQKVKRTIGENCGKAVWIDFDPWIYNDSRELIARYFNALSLAIYSDMSDARNKINISLAILKYASYVAPAGDLVAPGTGSILGKIFHVARSALRDLASRPRTIFEARQKAEDALQKISHPIIVSIDDIDRLNDKEIRDVARLVRAVGNFSNVSYLLSYDPMRIYEALGEYGDPKKRIARGRSYLEKIVDIAINVPIILDYHVDSIFSSKMDDLADGGLLPRDWRSDALFASREHIPAFRSIRQIERSLDLSKVLLSCLDGEVAWQDVIGFAVLSVISPDDVKLIRADPDRYVVNPISRSVIEEMFPDRGRSAENLMKQHDLQDRRDERYILLNDLFPNAFGSREPDDAMPNRICYRSPLMTLLSYTITRGDVAIRELKAIVNESDKLSKWLLENYHTETFVDKLRSYFEWEKSIHDITFWTGVSDFLNNAPWEKEAEFDILRGIADEFHYLFIKKYDVRKELRRGEDIFQIAIASRQMELAARILHYHILSAAPFGGVARSFERIALDHSIIKNFTLQFCNLLRARIQDSGWVTIKDPFPLFVVQMAGELDGALKAELRDYISTKDGLKKLLRMFFGGLHSMTLEQLRLFLDPYDLRGKLETRGVMEGWSEYDRAAAKKAANLIRQHDGQALSSPPTPPSSAA